MNIKIKLCGLRDKESILASSGAHYIGFVFYQKSPRFINALEAQKLRHYKKGNQKIISFYAKNARGAMARFIIQNKLQSEEDLKKFNLDGYIFNAEKSSEGKFVFIR